MSIISKGLSCILTVAFFIMFMISVIKLVQNEVGSRTHTETISQIVFPSISICPMEYNTENVNEIFLPWNFTIEEFDKLPSIKDHVTVRMMVMKSYHPE